MTLLQLATHNSDEAMTVINTNVEALKARLAGSIAAKKLDTASNRLASGMRLNSGADDAAGSAVSMKMNAQLMGQKAAIKAASDALSLLNLQEVAVEQFANITHVLKSLAFKWRTAPILMLIEHLHNLKQTSWLLSSKWLLLIQGLMALK